MVIHEDGAVGSHFDIVGKSHSVAVVNLFEDAAAFGIAFGKCGAD